MVELEQLRVGDRVVGLGRAGATWPRRPAGVVTKVLDSSAIVAWDNTIVEDEMRPDELAPAPS